MHFSLPAIVTGLRIFVSGVIRDIGREDMGLHRLLSTDPVDVAIAVADALRLPRNPIPMPTPTKTLDIGEKWFGVLTGPAPSPCHVPHKLRLKHSSTSATVDASNDSSLLRIVSSPLLYIRDAGLRILQVVTVGQPVLVSDLPPVASDASTVKAHLNVGAENSTGTQLGYEQDGARACPAMDSSQSPCAKAQGDLTVSGLGDTTGMMLIAMVLIVVVCASLLICQGSARAGVARPGVSLCLRSDPTREVVPLPSGAEDASLAPADEARLRFDSTPTFTQLERAAGDSRRKMTLSAFMVEIIVSICWSVKCIVLDAAGLARPVPFLNGTADSPDGRYSSTHASEESVRCERISTHECSDTGAGTTLAGTPSEPRFMTIKDGREDRKQRAMTADIQSNTAPFLVLGALDQETGYEAGRGHIKTTRHGMEEKWLGRRNHVCDTSMLSKSKDVGRQAARLPQSSAWRVEDAQARTVLHSNFVPSASSTPAGRKEKRVRGSKGGVELGITAPISTPGYSHISGRMTAEERRAVFGYGEWWPWPGPGGDDTAVPPDVREAFERREREAAEVARRLQRLPEAEREDDSSETESSGSDTTDDCTVSNRAAGRGAAMTSGPNLMSSSTTLERLAERIRRNEAGGAFVPSPLPSPPNSDAEELESESPWEDDVSGMAEERRHQEAVDARALERIREQFWERERQEKRRDEAERARAKKLRERIRGRVSAS